MALPNIRQGHRLVAWCRDIVAFEMARCLGFAAFNSPNDTVLPAVLA
jgi:hypothetical protein